MATYYYLRPDTSPCEITWRKPITGNPGYYTYETVKGTVSSMLPVTSAKMLGATTRTHVGSGQYSQPQSGDPDWFTNVYNKQSGEIDFTKSITTIHPLVTERTRNLNFRERVRAGEIVISDYSVGTATEITRSTVLMPSPQSGVYYGPLKTHCVDLITNDFRPSDYHYKFFNQIAARGGGWSVWEVRYQKDYWRHTIVNPTYRTSPSIALWERAPYVNPDPTMVTSVVAKMNSATFDLLTEIAEAPQSLAFIGEQVVGLANSWKLFDDKHRKMRKAIAKRIPIPKRAAAYAKALASVELQFRYAVMPIIYSIDSVGKVLERLNREYRKEAMRGDVEIPLPRSSDAAWLIGEPPVGRKMVFLKTRYTPDSIIKDLRRLIGVNPVTTLWELTPYSFVIDWVVPIGDFLTALTTPSGADQVACTYSVQCDKLEWTFAEYPDAQYPRTSIILDSYARRVINPYDHIGLRVDIDMDWIRYLDGVALSIQRALKSIR